jgi:hypothetical protein
MLEAMFRPRISLLWGSRAPTRTLLAMLTVLASQGQTVRVFDGGNRFDGYFTARLARRLTSRPTSVLSRIRLSRAFTCFQLAELIETTPSHGETSALFVLDLLSTFYDESVPLRDTERLLASTITHLKRLAEEVPVIVGAREPQTLVKDRWALLEQLQIAADNTWRLRLSDEAPIRQPKLL